MSEMAMDATPDESMGDESLDETLPETNETDTEVELTDDESLTDEIPEDEKPEPKPEPKAKAPKADPKAAKPPTAKELSEADLDAIVKVKIDGETKEMTVRDLMKIQSLEQVSQKRMNEAAQERRKAAQLMQLAKTNPEKFLELTGIDPDEFATNRLASKYELMQMTPEQRELHELKTEKEQREQAEMQTKSQLIEAIEKLVGQKAPEELKKLPKERLEQILVHQQELERDTRSKLDDEMREGWKDAGLPANKYLVQMMAAQMRNHMLKNREAIASGEVKPLQAKEAAAIVKRDFLKAVTEIFETMDPSGIQEILGTSVLQKLRDHDVARVTGKLSASKPPQGQPRPGSPPASQKRSKQTPMNEFQAREYMEKLKSELRD